jgi:hypothetical protein
MLLAIATPVLLLLAAGIWFSAQFLHPFPPRHVTFAAGPRGGVLQGFAQQYRDILARDGVTLDVKVTRGAGDNLAMLAARDADVGFLVAGATSGAQAPGLVSLGNVAYAPLWVLYRGDREIDDLARFAGLRIAVGAPGSGLAAVLGPLLDANGITARTSRLVELPFDAALAALLRGEVDVAFLGEGPQHPEFIDALARPGIRLMDFARASAYARRFTWVRALTLPEGTLDFARDIPSRDARLIGSTVMIAANASLHPTIVDLLVDAASEVHGGNGYFEARGEFPQMQRADALPMSGEAVRYARSGPTFLRRYLPLWLADLVQRLVALVLPFLLIALPALRWIPPAIGALSERRIQTQYTSLRDVERRIVAGDGDVDALRDELDRIEAAATAMRVPAKYAAQLFQLRAHVSLVRQVLEASARHRAWRLSPAPT